MGNSPAGRISVGRISDGRVGVGVLGCGHVGSAFLDLLAQQQSEIAERTGLFLAVQQVAVRSVSRDREVPLDDGVLTTDAMSVVNDPATDVVVELIGGIEPARELVMSALRQHKPVITANKELLATYGAELYAAAEDAGVDLLFEAAVGGGIPVVRLLRASLVAEPILRVMGIVNGTTNYILSQMTERGVSYHDALADAQSLGFAERDPSADVEGFDAAAKASIIATITFGAWVGAGSVYREGISGITAADIADARQLGYAIKLLAVAERVGEVDNKPELAVRVHPAMVPVDHPLASVRDSFNAMFVEGMAVGDLMFYGRGAGGRPTASAVLGDLVDAANNLRRDTFSSLGVLSEAGVSCIDDLESEYYINMEVTDRPGVLAAVAGVFGSHRVSIRSMEQAGLGDQARLVFITHRASERDVQATLGDLRELDAVRSVPAFLRVVG
ncbi:MAG: homoserine dehydrogenase [Acidimicrobiia bacterium]|nr:homoserine dehydrogenase [Acidimicrobiia bacterium]MYC57154.1 homoserine dehydrogenase [Acidimicrobiia bacterium]MYG93919.1 homoserine dehydrogenase [Acidimicrobiia bacterium]MYI29922.1 homoserine dehydrogenase [Acidimicrobiia bacterium]